MPELPEVETTRRGLEPYLCGETITRITLRVPKLRWNIETEKLHALEGKTMTGIQRRGKYLLINLEDAADDILVHLGMSGSLRVTTAGDALKKHDHVIIELSSGRQIRLHDPRRFGHFEAVPADHNHALLRDLGKEPLFEEFSADYLYQTLRGKQLPIKNHIMNQKIVVGVGNIYATEALFLAGIRPDRPAGKLSKKETAALAAFIKQELNRGIEAGGTTLRDFISPDGTHGYFQQTLQVYGRAGEPCRRCGTVIQNKVIGSRASAFCPRCQK